MGPEPLIVRNCPKEATIKFKVITYGAFGASKTAIADSEDSMGRRSSSSLGVGNENTSSKYNGVERNNAVIIEDQHKRSCPCFGRDGHPRQREGFSFDYITWQRVGNKE